MATSSQLSLLHCSFISSTSSVYSSSSGNDVRLFRLATVIVRQKTQSRKTKPRYVPTVAMNDMLGDFGARDPFPAEIESRFGEKVLGCPDTEHRILIPNLSALSLAELICDPKFPSLTEADARKILNKVIGWRVVEDAKEGGLRLRCLWKVRDSSSGVELMKRITDVTENTAHNIPSLHLDESSNQLTAELWSPSVGGLTMNDFIVAAKIDQIQTLDLLPKRRAWA